MLGKGIRKMKGEEGKWTKGGISKRMERRQTNGRGKEGRKMAVITRVNNNIQENPRPSLALASSVSSCHSVEQSGLD